VRLRTSGGDITATRAIVAAGPWLKSLLPGLAAPIRVTREVLGWFEPAATEAALFEASRFPVFLMQNDAGVFYGFPNDGGAGVKVAKHHHRDQGVDPEDYDRNVSAADEALIRLVLKAHLPAANGRLMAAKTCLYTMTADGDFILDHLPECPAIIIASPCSGHGFKFAPVVGEILADLATEGGTGYDIARFRLARFT